MSNQREIQIAVRPGRAPGGPGPILWATLGPSRGSRLLPLVLLVALAGACRSERDDQHLDQNGLNSLLQLSSAETKLLPSETSLKVSKGQLLYVPAYSHVYYGSGKQFLLAITLSVRNTSPKAAIILRSIRYFDSKGVQVKAFTEGQVKLKPLETTEFFIPENDISGGSGASFLVDWVAEQADATEPVVEAVMIGTRSQQGLAFVTTGRVIREHTPDAPMEEGPRVDAVPLEGTAQPVPFVPARE